MLKKIILGLVAIVITVGGVAAMSAYEAHIINVTATIENGLSIIPEEIIFGTVFPQEHLFRNLNIRLSDSFLAEGRVDDISYVIKQKPKCYNEEDGYYPVDPVTHLCAEPADQLPLLCPYLSKTIDEECDDISVPAFHAIEEEAVGHLSKVNQDIEDEWVIDLAVPCFEGQCDQGYTDWVKGINPNVVDPLAWVLPAADESKIFGCDLWIEVTGVSINYIDRVDFGNLASEGWHLNMIEDDWSYDQSGVPYNGSNYGGGDDGTFRLVMGNPTGCDAEHLYATFKMDVGIGIGTKSLVLRHLDGSQTDNFDVYVRESDDSWTLIGNYSPQTSTEDWETSEFDFSGHASITEFKIVATQPATSWCETYGQIAFSWAEIQEQ